jgi:biotin carboxyl carrier protein
MASHTWKLGEEVLSPVEGAKISWENDKFFKIYYQGRTFYGEVISANTESGQLAVKVNHRKFLLNRELPIHNLLSELGLDKVAARKLNELRAPMPGKVLAVLVQPGDEVQVGDSLITLEAMKMENVIKAEGVGIVKSIQVNVNDTAEKGALLISFE